MNITEPFVLKQGVQLIPCAELSDDLRAKISFDEGDYTLSHRYGRTLAQVIDGQTAALLALFREPRTIVDAVIENSRALGKDPEAWLDELLPHLGRFVNSRVLVPAGSEDEKEIRPQYESGDAFAGWKVVRCASLLEDSEIYQLRRGDEVAALKIARGDALRTAFENETEVLQHLDGGTAGFSPPMTLGGLKPAAPRIAPRLLDAGAGFLIMEWVPGVDVSVAAAQRRHDRASLIDLCARIASAYETLHARGVLHGDVHPRNVLAGEDVTLVDFGYARFADRPPRLGRAGLMYFFEPEYFASHAPASAAGEQFAVAALLYLLIAGEHYLDFRYDREEMARQVEHDPPLPFAKRGVPPWPEVEAILFRALEKEPSRRFASMGELAALLREARDRTIRESLEAPVSAEAHALVESTLRALARGGETFASRYLDEAPTASINYGCAGAAVGLLRIAETRGDPALLALADVWRSRAVTLIDTDGAYYNPARDLTHETLGDVTPYHTESGIHAAGAMIAAAMGDTLAHERAVRAFLRASRRPCAELDLTLGCSGSLLAASMLLDLGDSPELRAFGSETMRAVWSELDTGPLDGSLGMAHGWCGYLYAALRWCSSSGDALPPRLTGRLHEFAALKIAKDRGIYWPTRAGETSIMPGWCNGSAGPVFLFTLAHRLLGHPEWLRLAELAAWNNWDAPRTATTLCCGTAGRAYALLAFYKHTGLAEWLSRARALANHAASRAVATSQRRNSLWKGELGVAVLVADLASPENARMPFFE